MLQGIPSIIKLLKSTFSDFTLISVSVSTSYVTFNL
jgi:hypothetical protein